MPLSTRELQLVINARNRATRELKAVSSHLNRVQRDVKSLSRERAMIHVEAEIRDAERKMERIRQRKRTLESTVNIDIDAETANAERKVKDLTGLLERLDRTSSDTEVKTQVANAQRELRATMALLNELDRATANVNAEADVTRAMSKLREVGREADKLGRKSPTIKVDVDFSAMHIASRSVARLLMLPAIAAGVSILVGAITSLGAGAVAMGSAMSQALGVLAALPGLAAAGVSAVGTLGAAFFGVGDAVSALGDAETSAAQDSVDAANQRKQAARAIADAQRGLREAEEAMTRQAIQNGRSIQAAQRGVVDAHRNARQVAAQSARDIGDAEADLADAFRNRAEVARESARTIADAERAVADAVRNQRQVSVDAARAVADAQYDLRQSHRDVADAMDGLHEARQQAIQDLQDLRNATRDNALTEEGAQISLIEARQELIRLAKDDTSTSLDIRKARLGIAEAEARLSDAMRESRADERALAQARREGVRGSQAYRDAAERVRDAQRGVRESERGVSDAVRNGAQARRDAARATADAQRALTEAIRNGAQNEREAQQGVINAQRDLKAARQDAAVAAREANRGIADAERSLAEARQDAAWAMQDAARRVADAQRAVAQAQADARQEANKLTTSQNAVAEAMKNLSPEQRHFARFISSTMVPALRSMSHAAARQLLPALETTFTRGLELLPMVNRHLERTGGIIGRLAIRGARMVTSGPWKRDFATVLSNNERLIRKGGEAGFHFANAFRNIAVAALPITQRLADLAIYTARVIDKWVAAKRESGELAEFFDDAWRVAKQLWDMTLNIAHGIIGMGMAGKGPGQHLLNFFERVTERFESFTNSARGQNAMRQYFRDSVPVVKEMWRALEDIGAIFLELGAHPGTAGLLRQIRRELLPAVRELLNVATGSFGTALIDLITNIVRVLSTLSEENGGLIALVRTLNSMAEAFIAVTSVQGLGQVVQVLVSIGGAAAGVGLVAGFVGRLGRALGGPILAMGRLGRATAGVGTASRGTHRAMAGQGGFIGTLGRIQRGAGGAHRATGTLGSKMMGLARGRWGGIIAGGAAVAGVGAAAGGSERAMNALTYGAMGAMTGAMVGPWGAAIGGGVGALYGLFKQTGETSEGFRKGRKVVANYAGTLDQLSGKATLATRQLAAQELQQRGAFTSARQLGISTRDLVSATLGQEGAQRRVNRQIGEMRRHLRAQVKEGIPGALDKYQKFMDATANLGFAQDQIGPKFRRQQRLVEDVGEATKTWSMALRGVPKDVVTNIRQRGGLDSFKQLRQLNRQYNLTPKQVRTIIEATGLELTRRQLRALGVDISKLPNNSKRATREMTNAFDGLKRAMKASGGEMGDHNKKAREAARQFDNATDVFKRQTRAIVDQGGSIRDVREHINRWLPKLKAAGGDSDTTRKKVEALRAWIDRLTGSIKDVPDRHNTDVDVKTREAINNLKAFVRNANRSLGNIRDKTVTVEGKWKINKKSGGLMIDKPEARIISGRGRIPARAAGGPIHGPGTETSDSVLIRASRGEFMQRAQAVRREGVSKMAALNEGKATIVPLNGVRGQQNIPSPNMAQQVLSGWPRKSRSLARKGLAGFAAGGPIFDTDIPNSNSGIDYGAAFGNALGQGRKNNSTDTIRGTAGTMQDFTNNLATVVKEELVERVSAMLESAQASYGTGGFRLRPYTGYGGVKPWVGAVGKLLERKFGPFAGGIGGVGQRSGVSDHPSGHALDIMVMNNRQQGNRVSDFMTQYWKALATKYVIWLQRIKSPNKGSPWERMENRGDPTSNHMDHVHISFLSHAAKSFGTYVGGRPGETGEGSNMRPPWRDEVSQALRIVGRPQRNIGMVMRRLKQESGGRAGIVNRTDSNAARGTPSVGLMQVIGPTYQAYKHPKYDRGPYKYGSSVNPLANILASMRYALARYGTLANAYNRSGGYRVGGLVRDQGGLLPRGRSMVQNNTGGNEHLSVLNKNHMQGLDALAKFQRGGLIDTRVRPRLNRVAGRRDVTQAYTKNKGIKEFRQFLGEELFTALTGSTGQIRASKSAVKKQLEAVEKAIIEGLQKQSTRLEKTRKRIAERMENLDETHHKRSNRINHRAAKVRDRLETLNERGRHGKLSREKKRVDKRLEDLEENSRNRSTRLGEKAEKLRTAIGNAEHKNRRKQLREQLKEVEKRRKNAVEDEDKVISRTRKRLEGRAKELENRLENIESTGAQKRLRRRIAHLKKRSDRAEKEENKEIKKARKRMEERVSDITRKLVDVRRREAKDIERAQNQFDKLLPRMQKQMRNEYRVLENYSKRLVKMNARLTKARATLAARTEIRDEFANTVAEGVRNFGNILGAVPQGGDDAFLFTATYVEQQMRAKLTEIERFQQNLATLASRGLSDDLYRQFAEAGVDGAGAMVSALTAGTPENIEAVNQMNADLNRAADNLGTETSEHLYQAGVNAAQAIVRGIEQNIRQLEKAASKLARALVKAIKRALGIKSPSQIGMDIGANLRQSITLGMEQEDKRSKPPGFDPGGFAPRPPPGAGAASYGKTIKVEQTIYTQEIDPRKHAADLGYEFARRIGD